MIGSFFKASLRVWLLWAMFTGVATAQRGWLGVAWSLAVGALLVVLLVVGGLVFAWSGRLGR